MNHLPRKTFALVCEDVNTKVKRTTQIATWKDVEVGQNIIFDDQDNAIFIDDQQIKAKQTVIYKVTKVIQLYLNHIDQTFQPLWRASYRVKQQLPNVTFQIGDQVLVISRMYSNPECIIIPFVPIVKPNITIAHNEIDPSIENDNIHLVEAIVNKVFDDNTYDVSITPLRSNKDDANYKRDMKVVNSNDSNKRYVIFQDELYRYEDLILLNPQVLSASKPLDHTSGVDISW